LDPLWETPLMTVRDMQSQVWAQIMAVAVGYLALLLLRVKLETIGYLFWIGCMLTFMMAFALLISGIRPLISRCWPTKRSF
jgi:hypothetical protein